LGLKATIYDFGASTILEDLRIAIETPEKAKGRPKESVRKRVEEAMRRCAKRIVSSGVCFWVSSAGAAAPSSGAPVPPDLSLNWRNSFKLGQELVINM